MADQQPNNQLNIEISEEVAEGTYANLAIITIGGFVAIYIIFQRS